MKRIIILLLTCTLAVSLQAAKKPKTDVGIKYLDASFKLYDSLQKQIFNFAETGYKEFRSVEQWTDFLESGAWRGGHPHGIRGQLRQRRTRYRHDGGV